MSYNWDICAFAERIGKQYIATYQIMKGDILIDGTGRPWCVDKVLKEPNGFYTVLDEDGNGLVNIPPHEFHLAINRSSLKY